MEEMTISEDEAYRVLVAFTQLFAYPNVVLTAIVRNHVTPARVSLCDYMFTLSWTTWAGRNATVERNGLTLVPMTSSSTTAYTGDDNDDDDDDDNGDDADMKKSIITNGGDMMSMFESPLLLLNIVDPLRTRQGVVQHVDRLLVPDLSSYKLRPSSSPTASPSPSYDPTTVAPPQQQEEVVVSSPSPSFTPAPSTKTVPDVPNPVIVPFPSPTTTSTTGQQPQQQQDQNVDATTDSGGETRRTECFPGDATVRTCGGDVVQMRELEIGQCVVVDSSGRHGDSHMMRTSTVFAFSHRVDSDSSSGSASSFVSIVTESGETLTVSSKHYVPVVMMLNNNNDDDDNNNTQHQQQQQQQCDGRLNSTSSSTSTTIDTDLTSSSLSSCLASCMDAGDTDAAARLVTADAVRPDVMGVHTVSHGVQRVTAVRRAYNKQGLYAPHTAAGIIAVDGVVASCYTAAIQPAAAHALLAPVRWAFARVGGGGGDPVGGWLDDGPGGGATQMTVKRWLLSGVTWLTGGASGWTR